ncbi:hypothetical protein [Novosphingobium aquae]|uniref:Uncharacterized protein n=1 Tax=Novosphingobium aquae TaxID=3133435 RepID=A0ABU8SBU8_9SPHN
MPPESNYSIKEVLELLLKPIENAIIDLKRTVEGQELKTEKRFLAFDKELNELRKEVERLNSGLATVKNDSKWYKQIGTWVLATGVAIVTALIKSK